ncbi:F-box/LRR-repeat/kelch-repeat protein [Cardamine amara subsp. amara]|uniref:F-box/LRR-repeat/kelch-repeat protein n=1 Tax=Cardamine amara subsp. amara TaxID=228776 RepID=A0ABD1B2H0_CARAN
MFSWCPCMQPYDDVGTENMESLKTLVLGSSSSVKIPTPWENKFYLVSFNTCDGLVCLYDLKNSGFVVNPTTRWHRHLPLCKLQQLTLDLGDDGYLKNPHPFFHLGFGKDKFTGTYKPVWLYNSAEIGLDNPTTCEVFDFATNAWRYVTPSAHRIVHTPYPVFVDGSLHWFTECEETKVLSFDLHTEAFQVVSKTPFAINPHRLDIVMCNLDNRLCVSEMKWPNQVIWSFNSGNKTWDKMYSIDLDVTFVSYDIPLGLPPCALLPLALLDGDKKEKEKKKLLFFYRCLSKTLFTHVLGTKSYDVAFSAEAIGYPVCYFPSLFSI